jgi:acyl-CoA synthetase (AMP-forming)/AMP-acid ligase II
MFNEHKDWIVALYMKPTYRAVLCMLAAWKVGAGYLPLNYENPKRIKEILIQAKAQLVIVDEDFMTTERQQFPADFEVISYKSLFSKAKSQSREYFPDDHSMMYRQINDDNLAMVLYSSEIFVSPKGTRIHHESCQHRLEWQWAKFPYQYEETHCISHNAIYHIDHFAELWGPLLKGKTVVLMRNHSRNNIEKIISIMDQFDIMRFYGLPSKIDKMLDNVAEKALSNPKEKKLLLHTGLWISSGDVLEKETAEKFFKYYENDGKHIFSNFYGCTETTGDCCYFVMKSLEQIKLLKRIPLGIPNFGTYVYILDVDDDPVEKNQTGEIHIVGPMLASGYIEQPNDPTYKHNRYSLMPSNWSMFNTEDYGTIINGLLYYDGRKKTKVRYDGHNINYLVIEKFVKEFEYVEDAVIIATKEKLVVFIMLDKTQATISKTKIEENIHKELPDYALPDVVLVRRFPLLTDGKIDKESLIQEYNQANGPNIQAHKNLVIDLDGIPENKKDMAKRVFTIIGNNIGCELTGTIKSSTNFFNIGGSSLNVVSSIYELYRIGYSISAENFLKAKDFSEILDKIEHAERHSCMKEDYGFENNDDWNICIVRYDDLEQCLNCLLDCYTKKHVLVKLDPKMTADSLKRFIDNNWIIFVQRQLSFKVVDRKTEKTIGVALNIEFEEESYMKFEGFEEFEPFLEFQRFMEETYT